MLLRKYNNWVGVPKGLKANPSHITRKNSDLSYPLWHNHPQSCRCLNRRWRQKCVTLIEQGLTESKVGQTSATQTIVLTLAVLIFGGGSLFYFLQPIQKVERKADFREAATTTPLVNTTTGVGMLAAVAELRVKQLNLLW